MCGELTPKCLGAEVLQILSIDGPCIKISHINLPNCRELRNLSTCPGEDQIGRVSNTNLYPRPKERYLTGNSNNK